MNIGRGLRRVGRVIVHNWPLKLGAVILATLLYAGLVASQDSNTYPGPIAVTPVNQPADTVITNQLRDVEQIRYLAPADVGRLQRGGLPGDGRPRERQARRQPGEPCGSTSRPRTRG